MSKIDVSKCKHYKYDGIKKPLCRSGGCTGVYKSCLCVENTDCDYKQLQQLKAENEQLKAKIQEYVEDRFCQGGCAIYQFDKIEELKQENEELKKSIEILKDTVKIQTHTIDIKDRQLQQLKQERDLYKTWYRAKHDDLKNFLGKLKAENESYEYQLQKRIEICDSWIGVANKYKATLDEIEELQKELCRRCDLTFCGNTVCYEILQKIKQAKEGEE